MYFLQYLKRYTPTFYGIHSIITKALPSYKDKIHIYSTINYIKQTPR